MYGKAPLDMIPAFFFHDWGYWGMEEIDGEWDDHPVKGASILSFLRCSRRAIREVLCHSRFLSAKIGCPPSQLCWADKKGTALMPSCLWAICARLSGEGFVYMDQTKYEINKDKVYPRSLRGLVLFHQNYKRWEKNRDRGRTEY
jgi:hypothetical protein